MLDRAEVVVIGAGFAGAATAYHLARRGVGDVVVLEREPIPGAHASGRNAALVRRVTGPEPVRRISAAGAAALEKGELASAARFRRIGSLVLASDERARELEGEAQACRAEGILVHRLSPGEISSLVPLLAGARHESGFYCPADGVVDVHSLLLAYLASARSGGARILFSTPVLAIETQGGEVVAVATGRGTIRTDKVVNAAGAWAGELAGTAGSTSVPLVPYRRHLFLTAPLAGVSPDLPFVWDESNSFYFRPESGGLLLSPCDEEEHPASPPAVDARAQELLAERLLPVLPIAREFAIARAWACLRTFAPDRMPAIGPDPRVRGLFWVAGLGGHGMTASDAIGALAAGWITGEPDPGEAAECFSPERFGAPSPAAP